MSLSAFHPAVAAWFSASFDGPTPPQARGWASIADRKHTLIAAPTGSGKTLAAFLWAIDELVREAEHGELTDETRVVYVSPLKALSNDIERNLQAPLRGIRDGLAAGLRDVEIRTAVRTGDTSSSARAAMLRRPPHLFVTTPESLYILLTSEGGRKMLANVRTVIVDEVHALVRDKRGSHLSLSLERLEHLVGHELLRIGLSATQKPIEEVARYLVGHRNAQADTPCTIIDTGHARTLDLAIELPSSPIEPVMPAEAMEEIHDRLAQLVDEHRTTLIFVNTRRQAERIARHLGERIGKDRVTAHHGSLARKHRLQAEQRLKAGDLSALVATASLELGIDIGSVDLVCQIGSTRSIATLLQRVGRSGHVVGGLPKGRLFPQSRDDLVECAALLDSVRRGELDQLEIPDAPLDILAQQIVAASADDAWDEDELFTLVRRAHPYRNLTRERFDAVIKMLAEGFATSRGRRSAYLHRDAVNRRVRGRRGARLTALTSGGAIPDLADYQVVLEPQGTPVGSVNEDFAIESLAGDIFQLGNASWRILRVEPGRVRVEDAKGMPPTIPFWLGEAPGRTAELSRSVSRLRGDAERVLEQGDVAALRAWLVESVGLEPGAATQIADYLGAARELLGAMPTQDTLVLERFFDESGGMQLVVHAPFGARINRGWGLALRKRFCRKFNFELQAAASDDAIVLSLGPTHSFPLDDVFRYLSSSSLRDLLIQALLDAPMFESRWRWNATRALAVPRFRGGRRVAPQLQRMQADDLLSVSFPDQQACLENVTGDREIPDHPLVEQTIADCLTEAMDLEGLLGLVRAIEGGRKTLLTRDLPEPSPLAQEILNARPYAFLDDAPLEERRTQAVMSRRWLDPETAADVGALDPAAIARVRSEAWPDADDADELHDGLLVLGVMTTEELAAGRTRGDEPWQPLAEQLVAAGRATILRTDPDRAWWVAAERLPLLDPIHRDAAMDPPIRAPADAGPSPKRSDAVVELVRARIECSGPTTADALSAALALPATEIDAALAALESTGYVLRGTFDPSIEGLQWCERALLARINRYTIGSLRREIEPVSSSDLMRFLLRWQGAHTEDKAEGVDGLMRILAQLEGYAVPAGAWESEVLPIRMGHYDPGWLDACCLSGRAVWARLSAPANGRAPANGAIRTTPIAIIERPHISAWAQSDEARATLSFPAQAVHDHLASRGASFFSDIVHETGLLRTHVHQALAELAAAGRVTSDSFTGLRALISPAARSGGRGGRTRRPVSSGMEHAGRWSSLSHVANGEDDPTIEIVATTLLQRYGVVFRKILERERGLPPWRDLLRVYRRREARGELRGGRFVDGYTGEQFALVDAVTMLRKVRREPNDGQLVVVGAADPLNLVGVIGGGERLPAHLGNRVLYRDGVAVAVRDGGEVRWLEELDDDLRWQANTLLLRRAGQDSERQLHVRRRRLPGR